MGSVIQNLILIIFGLFLVLVLLFVLRIVHKQAVKMKDLETRMKAMDKIEEFEAMKAKKENT